MTRETFHRDSAYQLVRELRDKPGSPAEVAAEAIAGLTDTRVRQVATQLLVRAVRDDRRVGAREVEDVPLPKALDRYRMAAKHQSEAAMRRNEIQRAFDDGEVSLEVAVGEVEALNARTPDDYGYPAQFAIEETLYGYVDGRQWTGWRVSHRRVADIASWRSYARSMVEPAAERETQRRDERESVGLAREASWTDDLHRLLALRNQLPVQLTPELLETEFSIGDGVLVTWSDATAAEHRARVDAQVGHAAGTLLDAQRHAEVADLLERSGVPSLGELDERLRVAA